MVEIFGEGKCGESARQIIENEPCKECGGKAVRTIDFDLHGDLWQIPVCAAQSCLELVKQEALEAMKRLGQVDQINTFSMNGLGRKGTMGTVKD
ncbi:MAG: hypothetical protein ABII80_03630 [bacterium]